MPENYRRVYAANHFSTLSVISPSVSKVFPLLKHILCTAGRKQIPEDCVEIVTLPSCLVLTHGAQAQGLPPQKEGNVSRLPRALPYWAADTGEAQQFKQLEELHALFLRRQRNLLPKSVQS